MMRLCWIRKGPSCWCSTERGGFSSKSNSFAPRPRTSKHTSTAHESATSMITSATLALDRSAWTSSRSHERLDHSSTCYIEKWGGYHLATQGLFPLILRQTQVPGERAMASLRIHPTA